MLMNFEISDNLSQQENIMGLFSKNKINTYDSLKAALNEKSRNRSISARTINKLTDKLNNAKTVEELRTANSSLQNYQNPQIQVRIYSLLVNNKNANQIFDQAEAHKKIQKNVTTGINQLKQIWITS